MKSAGNGTFSILKIKRSNHRIESSFWYNSCMNLWRRFLSFILRMDVLNRILVFISMAFLIVVPSWILYMEDVTLIDEILPSLFVLGIVIGNGLLTLYKPIRTSWFYFLSVLFLMGFDYETFLSSQIDEITTYRNSVGIFVTMLVYNGICLILNFVFILYSMKKNKKPKTFDEKTNEDNPYDFLNAKAINKDIEKQVMGIVPENQSGNIVKAIKKIKFSRYSRVVSCAISFIILFYCLVRGSKSATGLTTMISSYGLIFLPVLLLISLVFPGDFKYIYYYDSILFGVLLICGSRTDDLPLFWLIVNLIIIVLALLVTLITEGRTWTGSEIDQD